MKKGLFAIILLTLILACKKEDDGPQIPEDCSTVTACTEQFVTLSITIKSGGNPLILNSAKVTILDNGAELEYPLTNASEGNYTLFTDSELIFIDKDGSNVRFVGLVGKNEVVSQDYVIGHDCCHVLLLEGPEEIDL